MGMLFPNEPAVTNLGEGSVLREGLTRWFWSREWARRQLVGVNKTWVDF